jgi:SP family general alpha glucoside:H+ symporter-like MFS transporter
MCLKQTLKVQGCFFLNFARSPSTWVCTIDHDERLLRWRWWWQALAKLCNGAGIGILQIVCQIYVMEIAPNRIRGGLIVFQAVWYASRPPEKHVWLMSRSNVGGIIVALMMQQLNKTRPDDYLLAMRVLWVPIGLMILVRPLHIA